MDQTSLKDYRVPDICRTLPVGSIVVAVVYAAVALVAYATTTVPGHISPIFPSAGIALAAVLILGRGCLLGVFLGSCAANTTCYVLGAPSPQTAITDLAAILVTGIGAMAGAAAGASLVRRLCRNRYPLDGGRDILVFIAVGAIGSCMISPTTGVLSLAQAGIVPWKLSPYLWLTWWVGDSAGAIVVAPLVLAWLDRRPFQKEPRQGWEAATLIAALLLLSFFVCFRRVPLEYGLVPLLLWAGYRFGIRGASAAAAVVGLLATVGTVHGTSAFVGPTVNDSLLRLHSFNSVFLVTVLLLAGVLAERGRADKAMRASAERYRGIVEESSVLVCRWRPDSTLTFVNQAYADHVGRRSEQLVGTRFVDLLASSQRQAMLAHVEELQLRKATVPLEHAVTMPDGRVLWQHWTDSPLLDANGEIVEFQSLGIDITDRKRAEAEILRLKNYLANIIDSMPSILVGMDNEETITQWNKQAETVTGIPAGQAVGRPLSTVLPDFSPWIESLRGEVQQRRPASLEKVLLSEGGERRFYDLVLYPLVAN
jgi:PAS domain S-box-containing protein